MDRFGENWRDHDQRIAENWSASVGDDDLVLVPGDISWAMRLAGAEPDLRFLADLPGEKVLLRGNHDYWWSSVAKVRRAVGEGFVVVHGDAHYHRGVLLAGTRMWDVPGLHFGDVIAWKKGAGDELRAAPDPEKVEQDRKIYERELGRLDKALLQMEPLARQHPDALRIALTHYPPCGPRLEPSPLTERFEAHRIHHVVFGHLHSLRRDVGELFGEREGIQYHLTSCDWLDFRPVEIAEVP